MSKRLSDTLFAICSSGVAQFLFFISYPVLIITVYLYGDYYGIGAMLLAASGPLLIWASLKLIQYVYEKNIQSSLPNLLDCLIPILRVLYTIILLILLCTGAFADANGISSDSGQNIESKNAEYHVTYSAKRTRNNSVGNEWNHGIKIDGEIVQNNSDVTTTPTITVTAFASEYDDASSDYGSSDVKFKSLDVGESASKKVKVTVRENGGRYSGNTATWEFEITVERIS